MHTAQDGPQNPPNQPPKLVDIPPEVATQGFLWLMKNRTRWGLSYSDVCNLLGGVPLSTLKGWHRRAMQGHSLKMRRDIIERISLLLGIHKALASQTPMNRSDLAWAWFTTPTELYGLGGESIRSFLLNMGTLGSFYDVRRQVEAQLH